jgi:beta-lactamase class A
MKTACLPVCYLILNVVCLSCHPAKKAATPTTEIKMEIKKEAENKEPVTARTDTFFLNLLNGYPHYFDTLVNSKNRQVQIIYTQIDRDEANKPTLTHYYYNIDPSQYYYPASTVKLPVAALALQKLNELALPELDRNTTMITDAGYTGQTAVYNDPTTEDGRPTIAHYIKKILLVSDNDAFNRLYEFLGQEYSNNSLHKMGYDSVQILHRLSVNMNEEQNRYTNPVTFYNAAAKAIYTKPLEYSKLLHQNRTTFLGKGYYSGGQLINQPFDFSKKNRLALTDLHSILQSLIFPETVTKNSRFNITEDDHQFLLKYMSMLPGESQFPQYDSTYGDAYVKFLLLGSKEPVDTNIRIFNKVGDAYGFLTDAAYIVDFKKGIEFMLSATIHCNNDGIYNDDQYEYQTVGFPFMKNLGQVLYQYESGRQRKHAPDLSRFKIAYSP